MSKNIKAITCPQCGSPQVTELRTDVFKCSSCGQEFILDDDKDALKTHHYYEDSLNAKVVKPGSVLILAGVFTLLAVLVFLLFPSHKEPAGSVDNGQDELHWNTSALAFLENQEGKPLFVVAGFNQNSTGENSADKMRQPFAGFYEADSKKRIKVVPFPQKMNTYAVAFNRFSDGSLYCILDQKYIYTVDEESLSFIGYSKEKYDDKSDFSAGFSTVEFNPDQDDSFLFTANDGSKWYYFPLADLVVDAREYNKYGNGELDFSENKTMNTCYDFIQREDATSGYHIYALVTYQYAYRKGAPHEDIFLEWKKKEPGAVSSEIKKVGYVKADIMGLRNFTPGRSYVAGMLLDYNDSEVLIAFKPTVKENDFFSIQSLDAYTGKPLWTYTFNTGNHLKMPVRGMIGKNGYFIVSNDFAACLDKNGSLVANASCYDLE